MPGLRDSTEPGAQLLSTKLHAPRRRRESVPRPRLRERLLPPDLPAITLVSAPAGFGKTTLLADCLAASTESRSSTAWVELDSGDNDPATFGSYIVAALQSVAAQVGRDATSLLQSSQGLAAATASLINDLQALDQPILLVLDDYHLIESTEVHEAITLLVDHAPARFHLVLASRADPPLPLPRWRAGGELLEIRAADLRFTSAEAVTYLNDSMGLELSVSSVEALEARTEGWIAALQLAALSLRGRDDMAGFVENFAGDDRFVVDYLAEEVLERQPEAVRTFLLQTSVLGRFAGSLCDAVTGATDGKATLEMLDRSNLFVIALDDRRDWYRYHHLFADVLRARLLDEQPDRMPEIHLRASEWFEQHGDMAEAIEQAIAGNHLERAARLIELAAPTLRATRQDATYRRWLEAIPARMYDDRPVLTVSLIGARMASGDTSGVELLLDGVDRWLSPPSSGGAVTDIVTTPTVFDHGEFARLPTQVEMYRAALALLAGDTDATIVHASQAIALADPSDHFGRGAASTLVGLAHWRLGELDQARNRYQVAVDSFAAAGFIPDVFGVSLGLADIQIAQGRLGDASRTYESALAHTSDRRSLRGAADMHVGLSELLIETDDLDAAALRLQTSAELGEHAGLPQHPYRWRLATARLCTARGDFDRALELLDEAERVYNTDFSPAVQPISAVRARVHVAKGDVASARSWVRSRVITIDDELSYLTEYEHITLAHVLLAEPAARPSDATILFLERLLEAARTGGRDGSVVELLVLLAIARHATGDRRNATAALDEALVLATPEGYVRRILDAGPKLSALLRSVSVSDAATPLARRLLAATGPTAPRARSVRPLVDELSVRELDVLRLLRTELSGPEIARQLHVSLNTLRTHTKSIYTKLGATNRREAIRLAAEHGL